ncbi:MAG: EAL domain-containing protein [Butyrivibrio sp.]|nr:EAL domain-containing protein [Butyrivibrio sp.]
MNEYGTIGGHSFRIAAVLICFTCLFYTVIMRRKGKVKKRTYLFIVLLISLIISSCTGLVSTRIVASTLPHMVKYVTVYMCKYIYFANHFMLLPLFTLYIIEICDIGHLIVRLWKYALQFSALFLELMILTNPFTHFVFYLDDSYSTVRAPGVYIAYVVSGIFLVMCLWMLTRFWKIMNRMKKIAMFYFIGLATLGTLIQMLFPNITCELMAESIGMMGLLIMIEREDDREDYYTRAYNRNALVQDLRKYFDVKKHFYAICLRIVNATVYRKIIGYEDYDKIMAQIADFLISLDGRFETYRINEGCFYLLCENATDVEIKELAWKINDRFLGSWDSGNGSNNISGMIMMVKCPGRFTTADEVLSLSQVNIDNSYKFINTEADLDFLFRGIDVERAIARGISENNFKVMYRPVYDRDTGDLCSAEALLTLTDRDLGYISFDEFMPIAERSGFITDLQLNMIESVFRFVRESTDRGDFAPMAMVIHILSMQSFKKSIVTRIRKLIVDYKMDPSTIVFAVAEPLAIAGQENFNQIVDELNHIGVKFSLSNYNVGFMAIRQDILYKYDGISMNIKQTLEEHKEKAVIVMRNRSNMLAQLNRVMVFDGVTDKVCYESIKDLPGPYIAGDYLCVPGTKADLLEKIKEKDNYKSRLGLE